MQPELRSSVAPLPGPPWSPDILLGYLSAPPSPDDDDDDYDDDGEALSDENWDDDASLHFPSQEHPEAEKPSKTNLVFFFSNQKVTVKQERMAKDLMQRWLVWRG